MPAALRTRRSLLVLLATSVLGACRVGGGEAIAPAETPVDPGDRDAGRPGASDGGHVTPAPPDGGSVPPAPGLDASAPSDGGLRDGAPPPDGSCIDECKPTITVPAGCAREDRLSGVYLFCSDAVRWNDARATCLSAGADLVVIEDEQENAFVAANVTAVSWIGASDVATEGSFVWISPGQPGTSSMPVSFARWAPATPDNCLGGVVGQQDCARIAPDGSWNDSDCEGGCTEGLFAFVCESY